MNAKVQSTLPLGSFLLLGCVLLDVVVLVFVVTLTGARILPRYGVSVNPAESRFHMASYDPKFMYVLTVAPGDEPRFFLESRALEGGYEGVEKALDELKAATRPEDRHRLAIVVYADKSISIGTERRLFDLVLEKGMICAAAAEPDR